MAQTERTGPVTSEAGSQIIGGDQTTFADRSTMARRRRVDRAWVAGRELGRLLGLSVEIPDDDLYDELDDLWHSSWMDRGVPERQAAGKLLLAAGWVPR